MPRTAPAYSLIETIVALTLLTLLTVVGIAIFKHQTDPAKGDSNTSGFPAPSSKAYPSRDPGSETSRADP